MYFNISTRYCSKERYPFRLSVVLMTAQYGVEYLFSLLILIIILTIILILIKNRVNLRVPLKQTALLLSQTRHPSKFKTNPDT